jgi:hypothetical protein
VSKKKPAPPRRWSEEELDLLRRCYGAAGTGLVGCREIAKITGRHEGNVSRKAGQLGLTKKKRTRPRKPPKYGHSKPGDPERRAASGRNMKAYQAKHGHPRGMAGKKHRPAAKVAMKAGTVRAWADPTSKFNTPEARARRAKRASDGWAAGLFVNTFSRCRRGVRPELGDHMFRSAWEANYARFLNAEIAAGRVLAWEFEPHVFHFSETATYTPDFRVWLPGGVHEWHEVKGWLTEKGRIKLALMAEHFPGEVVRLIDEGWFRAHREIARTIGGWEWPPRRVRP